jgi:hypothetical protein
MQYSAAAVVVAVVSWPAETKQDADTQASARRTVWMCVVQSLLFLSLKAMPRQYNLQNWQGHLQSTALPGRDINVDASCLAVMVAIVSWPAAAPLQRSTARHVIQDGEYKYRGMTRKAVQWNGRNLVQLACVFQAIATVRHRTAVACKTARPTKPIY